jgi:hypothetical protein
VCSMAGIVVGAAGGAGGVLAATGADCVGAAGEAGGVATTVGAEGAWAGVEPETMTATATPESRRPMAAMPTYLIFEGPLSVCTESSACAAGGLGVTEGGGDVFGAAGAAAEGAGAAARRGASGAAGSAGGLGVTEGGGDVFGAAAGVAGGNDGAAAGRGTFGDSIGRSGSSTNGVRTLDEFRTRLALADWPTISRTRFVSFDSSGWAGFPSQSHSCAACKARNSSGTRACSIRAGTSASRSAPMRASAFTHLERTDALDQRTITQRAASKTSSMTSSYVRPSGISWSHQMLHPCLARCEARTLALSRSSCA